jgi:hypothetical protein
MSGLGALVLESVRTLEQRVGVLVVGRVRSAMVLKLVPRRVSDTWIPKESGVKTQYNLVSSDGRLKGVGGTNVEYQEFLSLY